IGARLGPGPRDGLMTGLNRRTGRPVWAVRTSLEVSVVVLGWLLGGVFGVGTLLYAVAIGPLVQRLLPLFTVAAAGPGAEPGASPRGRLLGEDLDVLDVFGRGAGGPLGAVGVAAVRAGDPEVEIGRQVA